MNKFIFFRTPKPKGFSYKPLYYNETKERIEKLKKELEAADSHADSSNNEELRIKLRENFNRLRQTKATATSAQNSRLLLIIIALLILFWYLLKPLLS